MNGKSVSTQKGPSNSPAYLVQYLVAFSATMGAFAFGASLGYMSPAGSRLMNNTGDSFSLTKEQIGWFGSSFHLGGLIISPLGGLIPRHIGRRWTMLGSAVFMLGSWALTVFGQNFTMLVCGRIIAGLFMGLTCNVPTYIAEYASPNIRGTLGTAFQLMMVVGMLFSYGVAAFVASWRVLAAVCTIPTFIYIILVFFTIRESPRYLLSKGKYQEAGEALQYFRGKNYNIEYELKTMHEAQEVSNQTKLTPKDLKAPYIIKPLIICIGLMFFQQFSGFNAFTLNLNYIFKNINSGMDENVNVILVGLVQVLATVVGAKLIDHLGRKPLLYFSAITMTIALVTMDCYFYSNELDKVMTSRWLAWLPLTSLILFIVAFSIGHGPIPWVIMGEMFPNNVRDAASGIVVMANTGGAFIVTSIFHPLQESIGPFGIYWFFAGICVVNLAFCIVVVPETKGKTLEEIMASFGAPTCQNSSYIPRDNPAFVHEDNTKIEIPEHL